MILEKIPIKTIPGVGKGRVERLWFGTIFKKIIRFVDIFIEQFLIRSNIGILLALSLQPPPEPRAFGPMQDHTRIQMIFPERGRGLSGTYCLLGRGSRKGMTTLGNIGYFLW